MEPTENYQIPTEYTVPPKNWLIESILVTLFCCLPLGIAGIVNASKVESLFLAEDIAGAKKAADDAKKWTIYGVLAGIAGSILYVLFIYYMVLNEIY